MNNLIQWFNTPLDAMPHSVVIVGAVVLCTVIVGFWLWVTSGGKLDWARLGR